MFASFISNYIIYFSILGYSYLFKKILNPKEKDIKIYNLDFLYGLFFLIFLSIFFNFLIPLFKISYVVLIIGIVFFLYIFFKKIININLFYFGLILFFFSFITYDNGNNVDSQVYHIQTIKWSYLHKIVFGISNLDWLYSLNSSWHILLSILKFKYSNFDTIYVLNLIPLTILYYQIFSMQDKIKSLAFISLFFSGLYLIVFSVAHPFKNGVIFNHFGNPEVDTIAMIFFILSFYLFLKYHEDKKNIIFDLLLVSSFLCVTTKITYIGVIFFPAYIFFSGKLFFLKKKLIFISSLASFAWMLRSFILSSCLIYPVKLTCISTNWFIGEEKINQLVNLTKGFSRDTRLRERYTDFDYTIYSWDWFFPWFKDYYLNTAMLKISTFIIMISLIFYLFAIIFKQKNKIVKNNNLFFFIVLVFIFNIYIWFQAPEVRFGWGILIFFPCFFLALAILNLKIFIGFFDKKILMTILLTFFFLSSLKNSYIFTFQNFFLPYAKIFDYSQITQLGEFDGQIIYVSQNWKCADFQKICVNVPKEDYQISQKYGYLIFNK